MGTLAPVCLVRRVSPEVRLCLHEKMWALLKRWKRSRETNPGTEAARPATQQLHGARTVQCFAPTHWTLAGPSMQRRGQGTAMQHLSERRPCTSWWQELETHHTEKTGSPPATHAVEKGNTKSLSSAATCEPGTKQLLTASCMLAQQSPVPCRGQSESGPCAWALCLSRAKHAKSEYNPNERAGRRHGHMVTRTEQAIRVAPCNTRVVVGSTLLKKRSRGQRISARMRICKDAHDGQPRWHTRSATKWVWRREKRGVAGSSVSNV